MIPWWWVLIALIVGEFVGMVVPHFCGFNEREQNEQTFKYIKRH